MKILFTGGSSFTGYWFARQLAAAGHEVFAVFRGKPDEYTDQLRRSRVETLVDVCHPFFGVSFGDDRFLQIVSNQTLDILCHHAADATDYKSPHFDVAAAVQHNTHRLPHVFELLQEAGCTKIVLTGSVFENNEGAGSGDLEAFSPYGLSKGLTWLLFRHYARSRHVSLGKFVIPNPFGPYEEPRFTHYLVKSWLEGAKPSVNTPLYVRDNIHISLLARIYVRFVTSLGSGISRINPSGYIESQGSFASRLAREIGERIPVKCEFDVKTQTDFAEPMIRINTDAVDAAVLDWNEKAAWDAFAEYYERLIPSRSRVFGNRGMHS